MHKWSLANALPVTNIIKPNKSQPNAKIKQHKRNMCLTCNRIFHGPGKTIWKKSSQ